jgi:hypothetical protein
MIVSVNGTMVKMACLLMQPILYRERSMPLSA